MKIRTIVYLMFTGAAAFALPATANAQPRPPTGMRPAPPTSERREPPVGAHDEHHAVASEHHETEAQIRARMQNEEQEKTAQRQAARKDMRAWDAAREQRAARDRNETATNWGDIAERADAKAELATHAERMAQLNRILDVAKDKNDSALAARTNAVIQREITRDTRVLQGIRAKGGGH
ncbi:MAG: hypothetical protein ABI488_26275 [Polyangiaceae bacterium]